MAHCAASPAPSFASAGDSASPFAKPAASCASVVALLPFASASRAAFFLSASALCLRQSRSAMAARAAASRVPTLVPAVCPWVRGCRAPAAARPAAAPGAPGCVCTTAVTRPLPSSRVQAKRGVLGSAPRLAASSAKFARMLASRAVRAGAVGLGRVALEQPRAVVRASASACATCCWGLRRSVALASTVNLERSVMRREMDMLEAGLGGEKEARDCPRGAPGSTLLKRLLVAALSSVFAGLVGEKPVTPLALGGALASSLTQPPLAPVRVTEAGRAPPTSSARNSLS